MKHFMLKLNPPRPSFAQDMTAEERAVMQAHVAYWTELMGQGRVAAFGPVMDPEGVYGVGIVAAEDAAGIEILIAADPANGLNSYEFYPMMAVVPFQHE